MTLSSPPESSWPSWPSSSSTWRWAWGESSSRGWQGGQVSAMCSAARREPTWVELRGAASRPGDAKGPGGLPGHVQAGQGALPVGVHRQAAVVVLGAQRNLQGLLPQVDAVGGVQLDGIGIHVGQPLDGRGLAGPRALQVFPGLVGERGKALLQPLGVPAEIQEHPAAQGGFPVDQQVH